MLNAVSTADAVEQHLRTLLFAGGIRSGEPVKEARLARDLGIARPTVRVAVERLVAEGLLERSTGRSARVRLFSQDDVRDVFRVRRILEFEAVRAITEERRDIEAVEDALVAFATASGAWETVYTADARFHAAVVEAAGSPRLVRAYTAVQAEVQLMIAALRPHYAEASELYREHEVLLDSLRPAGGSQEAVRAWSLHLADAERFLVSIAE